MKMEKTNEKGQILLLVFVALGVLLFTVLFVTSGSQTLFQNAQYSYNAEQATALAEAGIDKGLASLNATWGSYNGESQTALGEGSYSVEIINKDSNIKVITATGYIPGKSNPKVRRTISVNALSAGSTFTLVKGTYVIR